MPAIIQPSRQPMTEAETLAQRLPIHEALPALKAALHAHPITILQAPPGAGKSTVLPLALLNEPWLGQQIMLMLEPRRLAARSVAARMADLRQEALGETVGYRVRFEQRIGPRTRIEVLTEGILTRRLQQDPELSGVGLVLFDEFHERGLHADLALALCREVQHALRDDLRILIMSATLDSAALSAALGNAPVITAQGRQYPITLHYAPRDPDGPIYSSVADGITRAINEQRGDVLAFLPGVSEIQRAQELLSERHPEILLRPLYGELSLDAQQQAIMPDPSQRRKVVLATSIAETSLTIEGIRVVVDCGYARVPRFDPRTGLTRLETLRVTQDSADQRAGRAGRLGPGLCYRLWSTATQARLNPIRKPEILEADLAPLRLEMAQWGARDAADLQWITPPPVSALRQAQALLQSLGALKDTQLTERGRSMLDWPTHPRLAHLLMESRTPAPIGLPSMQMHNGEMAALAADVAALLDERDPLPRDSGADLTLRIEALRHWRGTQRSLSLHRADARALARIERIAAQWRRQLNVRVDNSVPDPHVVGWLVSLAYPERIAQARGQQSQRYRLANGRGAQLAADDPLVHSRWLAVAQLDAGSANGSSSDDGRIFLAAPMDETALAPLAETREVVGWDARQGGLIAQRERRVGVLVLSSQSIQNVPAAQKIEALCAAVQSEGMAILPWNEATRQWQARVQSVRKWRGEALWPDLSDAHLLSTVAAWLGPWLDQVSRRDDFARLDLLTILNGQLTYAQQTQLNELAPTHLEVPSGSQVRLQYSEDGAAPVLAVKLQEMFGLADTPTVNEGRIKVTLHLLSPAQRPIQVTQDLRSFWANTYPIVRKELRGRYVKHPWPEDPWNAVPTKRTNRRGG